jgi:hypothetical protein
VFPPNIKKFGGNAFYHCASTAFFKFHNQFLLHHTMRTSQLKKIEISQQALSWLISKYEAVDKMDSNLYRTFLAQHCNLMFGNNPAVTGRDEVIAGIQQFWNQINGLDHNLIAVFGNDFHLSMESVIDYTRKDGNMVAIPCVTVIERETTGEARSLKIFIDTTPIFHPITNEY